MLRHDQPLEIYKSVLETKVRVVDDHPDVATLGRDDSPATHFTYSPWAHGILAREKPGHSNGVHSLCTVSLFVPRLDVQGNESECREYLLRALETGFLWIPTTLLKTDDDFKALKNTAWFQNLLQTECRG